MSPSSKMFSLILVLLSCIIQAQQKDTITISNSKQLLDALQSNRVLLLNSEHYQLPDEEVIIENISNLELIGILDHYTKITTSNKYNAVLRFISSNHIKLDNLSLGHWPEEGYCEGNVLVFDHCELVITDRCDLFGSGLIGLEVITSKKINCYNSVIRDCSVDIMDVNRLSDVCFKECSFYLNEKNTINYRESKFDNCTFYDASNQLLVDHYNGYWPVEPLSIQATLDIGRSSLFPWEIEYESEGFFENICPNIVLVNTSSTLDSVKDISYQANNLNYLSINGIVSAWVEGKEGEGIGEKIWFKCISKYADYETWTFNGIFKIINGYVKSKSSWEDNGRIRQFKVYRNNIFIARIDLLDTPMPQKIDLQEVFNKNQIAIDDIITFEISKIYKGAKYKDTAISIFVPTCSP